MEEITVEINGTIVKTERDKTILQTARKAGIDIPALCSNRYLEPYGGCRLCTVEIERNGRTRFVASCAYPVEEGLVVRTNTERIRKIRRMLLELILPISPTGPVKALAEEYGLKESRFTAEESGCFLCGLCVRYCDEVKKAHAIGFIGRGINRKVAFLPETASKTCLNCRKCLSLCPGGKLPRETDTTFFAPLPWEE